MALRSCFLTAFSAWQDTLLDRFKSSQICSRLWLFGSLFFYRGSLLMLTTSHHILGSTGRSALMFCGGCCSSPVARELCKEILYLWCKYKFCVSHCFWELRVHLEKQWFLSKIWKKICTYFICNLENPLFQVLSSTVSTQAMQRLTAGQGATKIRPLGKVPHKYSKWRKK